MEKRKVGRPRKTVEPDVSRPAHLIEDARSALKAAEEYLSRATAKMVDADKRYIIGTLEQVTLNQMSRRIEALGTQTRDLRLDLGGLRQALE